MSEIKNITKLLTKAFDKYAWHGPSVREVLATVGPADAVKRFPNTHSIIELVTHMTTWRVFVIRRLNGDDTYTVSDAMNFPASDDWTQAVRELEQSQTELLDALSRFPENRLGDKVPHPELHYTFYTLLHGIIHHDIYHIGQIMLIQKAGA